MSHDEHAEPSAKRKKYGKAIEETSQALGALAGGIAGSAAGPAGMVGGAAVGYGAPKVLAGVGNKLLGRILGPAEEERIATVFSLAAQEIIERINAGEEFRRDGFFQTDADGSTPAAELFEGTLKTAADSWEQAKLPYLAHFYASLSMRDDISPAYASALLQLAGDCTWRQLAALAAVEPDPPSITEEVNARLDPQPGHYAEPSEAIYVDLNALRRSELLGFGSANGQGQDTNSGVTPDGGRFSRANVTRAARTRVGQLLYEMMQLEKIPAEQLADIRQAYWR